MNTQNQFHPGLHNKPLGKFVLQGAGLALLLVIIFLAIIFPIGGVLTGKTFWEGVWQFLPLVTVTAGGALGGTVYYLVVQRLHPSAWQKVMATMMSILIYIVLLWLSLVAGFSATGQWD